MVSILRLLFPGYGVTLSGDGFDLSSVQVGGIVSAKSIDICSDVISVINTSALTSSELALSINLESLDLSILHTYVTPLTCETEWANRSSRFKTFSIAVSVFQHVGNVESGFPLLMELVENIETLLTNESNRVLTNSQAHLVSTASTCYDYTFAEEQSVFLGVVTAQYRVQV